MSLINLKEILSTDTDSEKLDKINYNFDQMANRPSGIGPDGISGINGLDGPIGPKGSQGNQGITGASGIAGIAGGSEWTANEFISGGNSTFKIAPSFVYENLPSTIVLGHPDVNSDAFDLINDDAQLKIYKNSSYDTDIRFTSVGSTDYFDIEYNESGLMSLGFNSGNSSSEISLESTTLNFKDLSENTILGITSTGITANVDMLFNNSDVNISGSLTLNYGSPLVDQIACSNDASGNIVWKDLSEIANTIPIGTIVPILSGILMNATNFTITHPYIIDPVVASGMYNGRGMIGTPYEGWYICNGKTWTDGASVSFDTPDLNSYGYDIVVSSGTGGPSQNVASNNYGQFNVDVNNTASTITSGRKIRSDSALSNDIYNVEMSYVNSSYDTSIFAGDSNIDNHSQFNLVSVPHVVYLGTNDLEWSDSGMIMVKMLTSSCSEYGNESAMTSFWMYKSGLTNNALWYVGSDGLVHATSSGDVSSGLWDVFLNQINVYHAADNYDYTLKMYNDYNAQSYTPEDTHIFRSASKNYYEVGATGNIPLAYSTLPGQGCTGE